jgi:hypothetical protein
VRHSTRSKTTGSLHRLGALAALAVGAAGTFALPAAGPKVWPFTVGVAALVGLASELAAWWRPSRPPVLRLRFSAWVLPALLTLVALVAQRLPIDGRGILAFLPGLFLTILALVLLLQDQEATRGGESAAALRFGLTLTGYAVAFGLFTLLFMQRPSAPLSAACGGAIAGMLGLAQLRQHGTSPARARVYAAGLALPLAQAAAAAALWSTPALVAGALLLLMLYVLAGLAEVILDDALDRRVLVEYGIVAAFGAALILSTFPWRA